MTQLNTTYKPVAHQPVVTSSSADGQSPAAKTEASSWPPIAARPLQELLPTYTALNATVARLDQAVEKQRIAVSRQMAFASFVPRGMTTDVGLEFAEFCKISGEAFVVRSQRSVIERSVVISALTEACKNEKQAVDVWGIVADYYASYAEGEAGARTGFARPAAAASSHRAPPR